MIGYLFLSSVGANEVICVTLQVQVQSSKHLVAQREVYVQVPVHINIPPYPLVQHFDVPSCAIPSANDREPLTSSAPTFVWIE